MDTKPQVVANEINPQETMQPTSRKQFLEKFPTQAEFVEKMEGFHGPFQGMAAVKLDGGRALVSVRFERTWHWCLENPANDKGKGENQIDFNLSPEAMCAMVALFEFVADQVQREADWDKLIASLTKAAEEKDEQEEEGEKNEQYA